VIVRMLEYNKSMDFRNGGVYDGLFISKGNS